LHILIILTPSLLVNSICTKVTKDNIKGSENLDLKNIFCYNTDVAGATSVRRSSQAVRRGSATPQTKESNNISIPP